MSRLDGMLIIARFEVQYDKVIKGMLSPDRSLLRWDFHYNVVSRQCPNGCCDGSSANWDSELSIVQKWLSTEQGERDRLAKIYGKEQGILGKAEYHIGRLTLSITSGASPTPRHGGWGQLMPGPASHSLHAHSHRANATKAIGPNPVPTPAISSLIQFIFSQSNLYCQFIASQLRARQFWLSTGSWAIAWLDLPQ